MKNSPKETKRPYRSEDSIPERHVIRLSNIPKDISTKIRKQAVNNGISEASVVNIALRKYYGEPTGEGEE